MRPECENEGCDSPAKYNGFKKDGSRKYQRLCNKCHGMKYYPEYYSIRANRKGSPPRPMLKNARLKAGCCQKCGFIPEHRCQLDLDHINGNPKDYSPENLQTLCANCHRLKTFMSKDWAPYEE